MRLIILGAGKYGREIEDVATQTGGYERIDFLDDYADSPCVIASAPIVRGSSMTIRLSSSRSGITICANAG